MEENMQGTTEESERVPLLETRDKLHISRVLLVAFTAGFAIAATAATTIFAYASILCQDPSHCEDREKQRYAGTVALATTIANIFGMLSIGLLQQWTKSHPHLGLCYWLACRATGVGLLMVAVPLRNIYLAVSGRIFEGLATDNILHYCLSAIYAHVDDQAQFSRLMGTSLALYMVSMSLSPMVITLLPSFFFSLVVSVAVLGLTALYLWMFVMVPGLYIQDVKASSGDLPQDSNQQRTSFFTPMRYLLKDRCALLPGLALLLFNMTQAYLFPAIMVYAALKFAFTDLENNYIVALAAATASVYMLVVLYLVPKFFAFLSRGEKKHCVALLNNALDGRDSRRSNCYVGADLFYALLSMSTQLIGLPFFVAAGAAPILYVLVVGVSLGIGAPSFIKSYAVLVGTDRESVLGSMAMMESLGGLLSSIVLGSAQSLMGGGIFFVAFALVGLAMLSLLGSTLVRDKNNLGRTVLRV
ncbi:hypothetical protein F5Y04DRAFT_293434 [Hypomontagnella monticulosa]|nr:hypothetical protein F5Y04DRAFT_293434 [Hypomontagnella monticulosa]